MTTQNSVQTEQGENPQLPGLVVKINGLGTIVLNSTVALLVGGVVLMLLTANLHRRLAGIPELGYAESAIYTGGAYMLLGFARHALLGIHRA